MTNLATGLVLGSPATRRARFTPLSLPDCAAWVGWGPRHRTASGASPILDATGEPYVYDSTPVVGSIGGTMGSAGSARFLVAGIESGGQWKQCALADDTNTHQDHSGAASDWTKFHQSATLFLALRTTANGFLCDTADQGDPNSVGVCTFASAASEYINFSIYNGTGTPFFTTTNVVGSLPINRVCIVELVFDGTGWEYWIDGVSIASGGVTGSAAPGAPANTLRLGASHAVTTPNRWGGNFLEMALYWGVKSAAERGDVRDYLASEWQATSELCKSAPVLYLPPWLTDGITVESGKVARVEDAAGNARCGKQTNDTKRPGRVVSSELGGSVAYDLDGSTEYLDIAGQPFGSAQSHSSMLVADVEDPTGFWMDFQTGRLVLCPGRWNDGAWRTRPDAPVGVQAVEHHLDATAGEGRMYDERGRLVYVGTYTPKSLGGAAKVFTTYAGGDPKSKGTYSAPFLWSGTDPLDVADPEQQWKNRAELYARCGLAWDACWHPGAVSSLRPALYKEMWIEGALVQHPKKFSNWTQTKLTSLTDDTTDVADPTGRHHAAKLVEDNTSGAHRVYETPHGIQQAFFTAEVYWHGSSSRGVTLSCLGTAPTHYARFGSDGSLLAAAGAALGHATSTAVGGGWYLLRARLVPYSVTYNQYQIALNDGTTEDYTGDGTSCAYIYEAWLEQAEAQLLHPFDFTHASWTKTNVTPTGSQSDPDGGTNAFTLTDSSDGAPVEHVVYQTPTSVVAGSPCKHVVYLKAGTLGKVRVNASGSNAYADVDLSAGTVDATGGSQFVSAAVDDVGGGWLKIAVEASGSGACRVYLRNAAGSASYQGDGTGTIYAYAPQVEQRRVLAEFDQSRKLGNSNPNPGINTSVAPFGPYQSATLSINGAAPFEGIGNLRATKNGVNNWGSAGSMGLSGKRCRVEYQGKGDGSNPNSIRSSDGSTVFHVLGDPGAAWAPGRAVHTFATNSLYLYCAGAAGFIEFDRVNVWESNDTFQPDAGAQPIYWPATEDEPAHLQFDGAHHWIGLLPATADMTLLGWFWLDQITSSTQCLVGARSAGLDFAEVIVTAVGELRGYCGGSAQYVQHSVTTFPVAGWHHVAFTCDGSGNLRIMLDGVSVTNTSGGTPPTEDMYLGARNAAGAADCFAGIRRGGFDQLNRALPESEILDIFEHEKAAYGL